MLFLTITVHAFDHAFPSLSLSPSLSKETIKREREKRKQRKRERPFHERKHIMFGGKERQVIV